MSLFYYRIRGSDLFMENRLGLTTESLLLSVISSLSLRKESEIMHGVYSLTIDIPEQSSRPFRICTA